MTKDIMALLHVWVGVNKSWWVLLPYTVTKRLVTSLEKISLCEVGIA